MNEQLEAVIGNISRNGMSLYVPASFGRGRAAPQLGELALVDIELHASRIFGHRYLRCYGTIVRLAQVLAPENGAIAMPGPHVEVALAISTMKFANAAAVRRPDRDLETLSGFMKAFEK